MFERAPTSPSRRDQCRDRPERDHAPAARSPRQPQARRPAERRLPGLRARPGQRGRRRPALPAGRRRPPDRLEPDGAHQRDPRPRHDRRPRARDLARRRRHRQPRLRDGDTARSGTSRSRPSAAFGFLTSRAGNRVAAVCFDGAGTEVRPPRSGRDAVLALLHHIEQRPRATNEGQGSLADALQRTQRVAPTARPRRRRVRPARRERLAGASCARSRPATTSSSRRSATRGGGVPRSGC